MRGNLGHPTHEPCGLGEIPLRDAYTPRFDRRPVASTVRVGTRTATQGVMASILSRTATTTPSVATEKATPFTYEHPTAVHPRTISRAW